MHIFDIGFYVTRMLQSYLVDAQSFVARHSEVVAAHSVHLNQRDALDVRVPEDDVTERLGDRCSVAEDQTHGAVREPDLVWPQRHREETV